MQIPTLQDILEITPKDHSTEPHIFINNIDPETLMNFRHQSEGFNEFLIFVDPFIFEAVGLKKGLDGDF